MTGRAMYAIYRDLGRQRGFDLPEWIQLDYMVRTWWNEMAKNLYGTQYANEPM